MSTTFTEVIARRAIGALDQLPTEEEVALVADKTIRHFVERARQLLTDAHRLHPDGQGDFQRVSREVSSFVAAVYAGTRISLAKAGGRFAEGEPNAAQCEGRRALCLDPSPSVPELLRDPVLCDIVYLGCMGAVVKSRAFIPNDSG